MKDIWQRIENWIRAIKPSILETLNAGATADDFSNFESTIGLALPDSFKDFLSIHNGQTWTDLKLFDGDRLLSIEDMVNAWKGWVDVLPEINDDCIETFGTPASSLPEKGIKEDWWNHKWIPITSNGSGDSYCIELDPTPEGYYGQIIRMWHDVPQRELMAPSFTEWINTYVTDLESGIYMASDEIGWGGIIRKEE